MHSRQLLLHPLHPQHKLVFLARISLSSDRGLGRAEKGRAEHMGGPSFQKTKRKRLGSAPSTVSQPWCLPQRAQTRLCPPLCWAVHLHQQRCLLPLLPYSIHFFLLNTKHAYCRDSGSTEMCTRRCTESGSSIASLPTLLTLQDLFSLAYLNR